MKTQLAPFGFLFLLLALPGCGRIWTTEDSWYSQPKDPQQVLSTTDSRQVPFHLVGDHQQPRAEEWLKDVSFVEVTADQAGYFTGTDLAETPGLRFYLVRGVCLSSNGKFTVLVRDGIVRVDCLDYAGLLPVPMKRRPLVIELDKPPKSVFVTCATGQ